MNTSSAGGSLRGRVGNYLGSPSVLAVCVVALVTLVGSISTLLAYRALCAQGEARAESDLRMSARHVRMSIDLALGAADPLLDRLRTLLQDVDPLLDQRMLLLRMRGLSTARPALARISVSFPDGRYLAVRRDREGALYAEVIRQDVRGAIRDQLAFTADGELDLVSTERTDYDSRTRRYYEQALARGKRTWTTPYLYLPTYDTGITRVDPVFEDPRDPTSLKAVLTIDFDTTGIEGLLGTPVTPNERRLVVGVGGAILAASGADLPRPADLQRRNSITWAELPDRALAAAHGPAMALSDRESKTLEWDGRAYRLSRAHITDLDGDPIDLITLSPELELFHDAHREARRGMLTTSLIALAGLVFAVLLSDNIARLRRKRAEAELGERRAREELAELGSYELIAPIKVGGMGEVHRARHRLLARDAALKLIRTVCGEDDAQIERDRGRFLGEARALASLRSVHTVLVYDFGIAMDGRHFLAMELLDGMDLHELVEQFGPQPAARTARILAQICDSLQEAHGLGVVHRDLKPANVFLCRQAEWLDLVKVLDFGLTRSTGVAEGACVSGTPGFMAPEQVLGHAVTAQADLYGVGCVGYWLLSGQPPHHGAHVEETLASTLRDEPPSLPEAHRHRVPGGLVQLITRCMARDPAHRPMSAALLARALRAEAAACDDFSDRKMDAFWSKLSRSREILERPTATPALLSVLRPRILAGDQKPDVGEGPRGEVL